MPSLERFVILVLILASASSALAGPVDKPTSPEARAHLEKGNALLNNGEFEAAIAEYKAGALIENAPLFQYNIALSYRLLGKYKESIFFYERFKARAQPTGEMLDGINQLIDQMKGELESRARTQPPTEPAPSTTTSATTRSTAPTSGGRDWFGVGLVSAGVVGVGVGSGMLWSASSIRGDADNTGDQRERDALYAKADTRSLTGMIVGGIGAAVVVTGVIKLVIGRGSNSNVSTMSSAWDVIASPTGVYAFGRF